MTVEKDIKIIKPRRVSKVVSEWQIQRLIKDKFHWVKNKTNDEITIFTYSIEAPTNLGILIQFVTNASASFMHIIILFLVMNNKNGSNCLEKKCFAHQKQLNYFFILVLFFLAGEDRHFCFLCLYEQNLCGRTKVSFLLFLSLFSDGYNWE